MFRSSAQTLKQWQPGHARARDPLRDHPPARAAPLAESEERHALALQGANDGLWDWDVTRDRVFYSPRWKTMLGYREHEVGDDARRVARPRARRRPRRAHAGARRATSPGAAEHFEFEHRIQHRDGCYRWMLARGDRGARRRRAARPRRRLARPTSPTAARPSAACSTTRCTTRSPACPTACCSSTASTSRSAAPSAGTPSAAPRCCSSTSTASRSSTTRSATHVGDQLLKAVARGSRRRCGPTTPSPASAATSSRCCSTTSARRARRR